MKPDQACIATATYAPECGCRVRVEVQRGDAVPVCPKCKARVVWQFVRSAYIGRAATPSASRSPAGGRSLLI